MRLLTIAYRWLQYAKLILSCQIKLNRSIFHHYIKYVHFYSFFLVLSLTSFISYKQPFALLFTWNHITNGKSMDNSNILRNIIDKQKYQQQSAYHWLNDLWNSRSNDTLLFSRPGFESRFFRFLQPTDSTSNISSYTLLRKPEEVREANIEKVEQPIVISILYSQQDTDHRQGTFYIGRVLQQLLKFYHPRFIITLCENNNTLTMKSDAIDLIRRLLPVFIVNTVSSDGATDFYEREKQAHLQCILANFQSFRTAKHLLLLQDDAEPADEHFYQNLLFLIDSRFKKNWPVEEGYQQPAFVKLYHPRWLNDYLHPSIHNISELIITSTLILTIFVAIISMYHSRNSVSNMTYPKYSRKEFSRSYRIDRRLLLIIYYWLLITVTLFLLNHSNVSWKWRSFHPSLYSIHSAPSCCLPAVIYFHETYQQVIEYLSKLQCRSNYAIDTAFDDLPKLHPTMKTYLVEPNLVHHIGLYSRLRHNYINPFLLD